MVNKGERIGVKEMRAHAAWYTKGLTGGAELRNLFNRAESAEDFAEVINRLVNSPDCYGFYRVHGNRRHVVYGGK